MSNKRGLAIEWTITIIAAVIAIVLGLAIIFVLKEPGESYIDFFNDLFKFGFGR